MPTLSPKDGEKDGAPKFKIVPKGWATSHLVSGRKTAGIFRCDKKLTCKRSNQPRSGGTEVSPGRKPWVS